jgi:hypothetical protein
MRLSGHFLNTCGHHIVVISGKSGLLICYLCSLWSLEQADWNQEFLPKKMQLENNNLGIK